MRQCVIYKKYLFVYSSLKHMVPEKKSPSITLRREPLHVMNRWLSLVLASCQWPPPRQFKLFPAQFSRKWLFKKKCISMKIFIHLMDNN